MYVFTVAAGILLAAGVWIFLVPEGPLEPPHWLVLVVVLVLDFTLVFEEEDENEEDGTFWCFTQTA